jgi:hypothetical protein
MLATRELPGTRLESTSQSRADASFAKAKQASEEVGAVQSLIAAATASGK